MFAFLVSRGFRAMFHRDPCHKLSNVFIATLRRVPQVLQMVYDLLVVFKFRRAPFGSGRFLRATVQTICLLVGSTHMDHPVMEQYRDEICRDIDVPPEFTELNPSILSDHFQKVIKMPIGFGYRKLAAVLVFWGCSSRVVFLRRPAPLHP